MRRLSPLLVLLAGCASFSTEQTDVRYDQETGEKTTITTKAASWTFFDSRSALANFKAIQTEKSQSASVGSLNQDASATNVVDLVERVSAAVVGAAIKAAIP